MSSIAAAAAEAAQIETGAADPRPLSDEERALLQRLLSDPFNIPMTFKTWLISFLEGSDVLFPRSSVQGLTGLLATGGSRILGQLPAGLVFPYAGSVAPDGTYLCNGAGYDKVADKRLFDVIGYSHGGSGSIFNVPDYRRRTLWGAGVGVGVGATDGQDETNRHIAHYHDYGTTSNGGGGHSHSFSGSGGTDNPGDHSHGFPDAQGYVKTAGTTALGSGGTVRQIVAAGTPSPGGGHTHGVSVSGSTSGVGDHNHWVGGSTTGGYMRDYPAFAVCGFVINH